MAFTDILGQYASNRLDSAMQPFSDPEAYLRQRLLDEEEERKKKEREDAAKKAAEEQAAQQQAVEQAQAVQSTQQAQPGQSVAQVPAGMANPNQYGSAIAQGQTAEPVAPVMGGPAPQVQEQANIEEQRRLQQAQVAQAQPAAPVAPEPQPQAVQQPQPAPQAQAPAAPVAPQMPQLPQPGPAVQVAGPAAVPPAPFTGQGIQAPAAPAPAAPAAPQMTMQERIAAAAQRAQERAGTAAPAPAAATTAPVAEAAPVRDHMDTVADIYNDPAKLMAYSKDETNPREGRLMAAKLLKKQATQIEEAQKAEEIIQSGDVTAMERAIRSKREEGSILKAMLYARLGLNKLAEDEQSKLGAGSKYQAVVGPNNERALVQYDANNLPISGFDATGKELSPKQLAMFGANALPTQAHLMPQVRGTPVVNTKGEMGLMMYDPRSQTSYVQVGSERRPATGWTTMSQSPEAVYGAAGAKQQGTQAAQTGTQQAPLPQMAGGAGAPVDQAMVTRLQGDVAGADRQIAELSRLPNTDPTKQQRIAIVSQERAKAQQQLQAVTGVPGGAAGTGGIPQTGGAGGQQPGENYIQYQERIRRQGAEAQAAATANIELGKEERSNFLTYEEKEIVPKADAGGSISSTRKSQLKGPDGILANPEIVGMMQGQGGAATEVGNIIRDLITGEKDNEDLSRRVASLNLTQRQKDVLYNQIGLNRQIAPKTLKENAGAGSVSDAEQKANREAAVDVTRVPLYTAVSLLSKDQFDKDQQVARAAFRQANPALGTVRAFNDAWGKEKARLDQEYNQIYAARAQYISKYYNGGQNPGAIVDAYKYYPVPEFNRQTGRWDYGTDYARKVARPKLSSFER